MRLAAEDSLNKFFVLRKFSRVCVIFVKFVIPKYKYECYFVVSCLFFHADTNAKIKLCKIVKGWRLAAGVRGGRQTIQDSRISLWSNTACGQSCPFPQKCSSCTKITTEAAVTTIMGKFSGRRALVTGAGGGIGRATALKLAEMGAEVFALSKTLSNLESLKQQCPNINIICVDLENWNDAREAVKKITPIHLLVNNAAYCTLTHFLEATPESFDKMFDINVKAILNITQVVAGDLVARQIRGSVVNLSSQAGQRALPEHTLYCTTKSAVDMLTKMMALELGPKGIRANAVCPTVVMTDMGRFAWSDPAKAGPMLTRIPQGRFAEVDEVVNAIVYLLSDESDMVNGNLLAVDGGFLAA